MWMTCGSGAHILVYLFPISALHLTMFSLLPLHITMGNTPPSVGAQRMAVARVCGRPQRQCLCAQCMSMLRAWHTTSIHRSLPLLIHHRRAPSPYPAPTSIGGGTDSTANELIWKKWWALCGAAAGILHRCNRLNCGH